MSEIRTRPIDRLCHRCDLRGHLECVLVHWVCRTQDSDGGFRGDLRYALHPDRHRCGLWAAVDHLQDDLAGLFILSGDGEHGVNARQGRLFNQLSVEIAADVAILDFDLDVVPSTLFNAASNGLAYNRVGDLDGVLPVTPSPDVELNSALVGVSGSDNETFSALELTRLHRDRDVTPILLAEV